MAVTVFQTENLELNALKMHFWKTGTTVTAIHTETVAVYGEMTSLVTQNNSLNKHFCNAWMRQTDAECEKRLSYTKNGKSKICSYCFSKIYGKVVSLVRSRVQWSWDIDVFYCFSNGKSIELAVEIDRFKRLARSSETKFDRIATAFDVLQWLAKSCLPDSTS